MVGIRVEVDTKQATAYLKKIGKNMDGGMNAVLDRELATLINLSKAIAPFDTGALRSGIMLGRTSKTKKLKKGTIIWDETEDIPRRRRSFANTEYKTFADWLHKSLAARTRWRWRGNKKPNFFDVATDMRRKEVIKGVKITVDKAIRGK